MRRFWGTAASVLLMVGLAPAAAGRDETTRASCRTTVASPKFGETSLFATVDDPGHPFGVLAADREVHVVTSSGFHADRVVDVSQGGERLFTFSKRGELLSERRVDPETPDMGFYGLALDAEDRLYVGDMNGRILRYQRTNGIPEGAEELFARSPVPYAGWETSMWNGIVFDPKGTLYVADDRGAIWRVDGDGKAEEWFRDPRLLPGIAGPFGAALGPDEMLYFIVVGSSLPGQANDSIVYRLPLVEDPSAADLEEFYRFRATSQQPIPSAIGIAFGRSGCAYVSLMGTNELSVISPEGDEVRRLALPDAMEPLGVSFLGPTLLVTAGTKFGFPDDPESSKIVRVWIGEPGLPLVRP